VSGAHSRDGTSGSGGLAATAPPAHQPEFDLGGGARLRTINEEDADELSAVIAKSRDHLARWMPWAAGQTLDGTLEFIRQARKQAADNLGFQRAMTDEGRIVGTIGFHRVEWEHRLTSIGYWIAQEAQGRGIVTRSVHALTGHALDAWMLNRVEIRAGVENLRSRAIPERLGFVQEGVLREAERVGDRFVDHAVYSMLAREWTPARQP
jgi:ribosomal-protein-serine acetyltransferase